ncbi:MAG: carboxypeptidase-like regulatory domain-containing protein [Bacteroidota bacterium]
MKSIFALLAIVLLQLNIYGQDAYTISGIVKNAKGEPIESATIFLAGSEKVMPTNVLGRFIFQNVSPGTYQVVVNMLGYTSFKQNVILKTRSEILDFTLKEKQILINEVIIGDKDAQAKHLKTFLKYFMGQSANAKACKILNPEIIEFSTSNGFLKATTEDFLIIENNNLGYKVKYLLNNFQFNKVQHITYYGGNCILEQMQGTPTREAVWDKNRKLAYEGSLMHYLRSLYAGTSRKEGFLVYDLWSDEIPIRISVAPIVAEDIVRRPDSTMMVFNNGQTKYYIVYDKKKAAREDKPDNRTKQLDVLDDTGSMFRTDAQIDSRGSYSDNKLLSIEGYWGSKRIGDQLPFEYDPSHTP